MNRKQRRAFERAQERQKRHQVHLPVGVAARIGKVTVIDASGRDVTEERVKRRDLE